MAKCSNCGKKLRLTDWKPTCPHCGVNLNFFNANEKLLNDSEKAEIEHAHFQPKIDRAKASYAGSKMAVIRIILTVLPLAALMLPLVKINSITRNAIDVYKYLSKNAIGEIFTKAFGGDMLSLSLVLLLISAAMFLVTLILIIMALGRLGKIRNPLLNAFQLACAIGAAVAFSRIPTDSFESASLDVGIFVFIGLIVLELVWNIVINIVGIPVKYKTCLIGGLPSEEYFGYVKQGMSKEEIRRKMLVALADLTEKASTDNEEKSVFEEVIESNG